MAKTDQDWVGLLRAIGPATHAKMSMADLRAACETAGLTAVRTLLASGNLIFRSARPATDLVATLQRVLQSFGLDNRVFLRSTDDLRQVLALNPMPRAAAARPNHLLVLFLDRAPGPDAARALLAHGGPEPVQVHGREVFIDYLDGVARSRLTPARLERLLGQPGTARNWNTVGKLAG